MDEARKRALDAEIERRRAAMVLQPPPEERHEIGAGAPNAKSGKTLEALRGLSRTLAARLTAERESHIVKITTLATELCDLQGETIAALEARIRELEAQLTQQGVQVVLLEQDAPDGTEFLDTDSPNLLPP
jgi:L-lactate utilization protein LutB